MTASRREALRRPQLEALLGELIGREVMLPDSETASAELVDRLLETLAGAERTDEQAFDLFSSLLVVYGAEPVSAPVFARYLGVAALRSAAAFATAVERFQIDAIRLFSTLGEAWRVMNGAGERLDEVLAPLARRSLEPYRQRTAWTLLDPIPAERLADLGYISAAIVQQEASERRALESFLRRLAQGIRSEGRRAVEAIAPAARRQMDSLLRKFDTRIEHGLFSPLFAPDPDELEREAARLAPRSEEELLRIAATQAAGLRNLAQYLAADHMDVYVATSMRSHADFVSVNRFVESLFGHPRVAELHLRHFNPTQSWIDDRIAKGLVEALMLRRADVTIYMAQKSDTFGKDSEASVALGQGKPVIVYVPRLRFPTVDGQALDSEELSRLPRAVLASRAFLAAPELEPLEQDLDREALIGRILSRELAQVDDATLAEVVREVWADFDLYGEANRIDEESRRAMYREWLDHVTTSTAAGPLPAPIRADVVGIVVAVATRFEQRARLFREIHPLALQVILSSGVLNGILVVRSVEACAQVLVALLENDLELERVKDALNDRLVERTTGSTIRVISRHRLLRNAFETFEARRRSLGV